MDARPKITPQRSMPMTTEPLTEDLQLIETCIQGKAGAWHSFIKRYSPLVYYVIRKVLYARSAAVSREELADLHNDIFASIMDRQGRKLRQYEGKNGCSVSTWIRVIAVRAAIDHLKKRRDAASLSDEEIRAEAELAAVAAGTPLTMLENQEQRQLLRELIDGLPPKDQLFIRLFYFEGVPPAQIARTLRSNTNAVYSRAKYLREKLKESLQKKLSKK
jgi:RNA polymerase sigma factor (sigma-70 family)